MRLLAVALALFLMAPSLVRADENKDLDLIPGSIGAAPAPAGPAGSGGKLYLEDALTTTSLRGRLAVPLPPGSGAVDWRNRTSLDGSGEWRLSDTWRVTLSDRLNLFAENDLPTPSRRLLRNDFREGYLTDDLIPQLFVDIGRINVWNGAALGFNPTDFFKTRSQVSLATLDPSVLREDRLGAAMLRGQWIFAGGSLGMIVAPKLAAPAPIVTGFSPSFDPGFGSTNGTERLLFTASADLGADISPQFLLFRQGAATRYGANLSRGIGNAVVAYAEWAGGRQAGLASRAEAFGVQTGTLPATVPPLLAGGTRFQNDLAIGGSWTSSAKVTVNLEYHYHQSGFDRQDWKRWFATGQQAPRQPLNSELWYLRAFAADQQEPATRQQAFFRVDWTDAVIRDLELSGLAFIDLYDGSTLGQIAASYNLNSAWTISALASASLGGARSERGSMAQQGGVTVQLVRYF